MDYLTPKVCPKKDSEAMEAVGNRGRRAEYSTRAQIDRKGNRREGTDL